MFHEMFVSDLGSRVLRTGWTVPFYCNQCSAALTDTVEVEAEEEKRSILCKHESCFTSLMP